MLTRHDHEPPMDLCKYLLEKLIIPSHNNNTICHRMNISPKTLDLKGYKDEFRPTLTVSVKQAIQKTQQFTRRVNQQNNQPGGDTEREKSAWY